MKSHARVKSAVPEPMAGTGPGNSRHSGGEGTPGDLSCADTRTSTRCRAVEKEKYTAMKQGN